MSDNSHGFGRFTDSDILQASKTLGVPGPTANATRLLAALSDPKITISALERLIHAEPGLTVRVLRVANSAFYALQNEVATISHASRVLGLDGLRNVAAAACFDRRFSVDVKVIDPGALHLHSLATAVAARNLTKVRDASRTGLAFVAGLLHDLGIVIQSTIDASGLQSVVEATRQDPTNELLALEAKHVRIGHAHCGGVLLRAWGLPPAIALAAHYHHNPTAAPDEHRELAALVAVADQVSRSCGMTFGAEIAHNSVDDSLLQPLGLTSEDVMTVAASLPDQVAELERALA